ncbi:MAG TPA: CvpA family protein, partial [Phycisphaerales bacterium]|nr:CvpA family protein [Phycisphaerales bacterium]
MAGLLVVLIILGCAVQQYLKSTFVKSFTTVIITICAAIVAFGYFEMLAEVFTGRGGNSRYPALIHWAQPLSFVLLFVLAFAVLQTIAAQLTRHPVDLGLWPERIGRVVCGIFLGLILSGLLLTALAMAPLANKYPYQRFDATSPDAEKPNKVLLNADGFATGWFNIVSSGSFSGKRSFAALHPAFLDQLFLNRHNIDDNISIATSSEAIEIPKKKAAWPAPQDLKDSKGKPVSPKSGHNLTIVRVGIKKKAVKDAGTFTLSQLRLICKQKNYAENPLAGKGKNIYPVGYLKMVNQLQEKRLNDQIKLERADFDGKIKWIDFAFYVPKNYLPVLVEFKQNNIAMVPPPVTAEQAPPAVFFIQLSKCATDIAELEAISSAKVYGVELAAGPELLAGLRLKINDPNQWRNAQTADSIKPAQFEDGKINYVRAELKIEESTQDEAKAPKFTRKKSWKKRKGIPAMLKPLKGYRLLSLKCNNPSTGVAIKAEQLPVLVELSGLIHRPVGIIASGKVDDQIVYEVDYRSLTAEDIADG